MAIKSGFFNSVDGDRLYDAHDFNRFFDGVISDGVFSGVDDWLSVSDNSDMTVLIGAGKAWFLQSYLINTQTLQLAIDGPDAVHDRIDSVIMDFNVDTRTNTISILTGTPGVTPTPPALIQTSTRMQIALCDVLVEDNTTTIEASDITNYIGTDDCPFVTGLIDQVSTSELLAQWSGEFLDWLAEWEDTITELDTTGALAELIDMRNRPFTRRNLIINGAMQINLRNGPWSVAASYDNAAYLVNPYPLIDRWKIALSEATSGTWSVSHVSRAEGHKALRMECTTISTLANQYDKAVIMQHIEGFRCTNIRKGTADAKKMVLTFAFKTNVAGTYVVELIHPAKTHTVAYSFDHPGGGTQVEYSWTVPASTNSAKPITMDNNTGLTLLFWLSAGSSYTTGGSLMTDWTSSDNSRRGVGQVNLGAAVGNYAELSEVQLEVGDLATDFEYLRREEEIALCRRYCESYPGLYIKATQSQYTQNVRGVINFAEPKRNTPTITAEYVVVKHDLADESNMLTTNVITQLTPDFGIAYYDESTNHNISYSVVSETDQALVSVQTVEAIPGNMSDYAMQFWLGFHTLNIDAEL